MRYDSKFAKFLVAAGKAVGDYAECAGDKTGVAVIKICEKVKEKSPHAVTSCPSLTRNGKAETTIKWY